MSGRRARIKRHRETAEREAQRRELDDASVQHAHTEDEDDFGDDELRWSIEREFHELPDVLVASQGLALVVNLHAMRHSPGDDRLASFLMCILLWGAGVQAALASAVRHGLRGPSTAFFRADAQGSGVSRAAPVAAVLMDSPTFGPTLVDMCSYDDPLFYDGKKRTPGRTTLVTADTDFEHLMSLDKWEVKSLHCHYTASPLEGDYITDDEALLLARLAPQVIAHFSYLAQGRPLSSSLRWS